MQQPATRSGFWSQTEGAVSSSTAYEAWAQAAYPALIAIARTYHAVITYRELGDSVQAQTGIRTSLLLQNWIGEVLKRVVEEAHRRSDPPLTALVVHTDDGMVGGGYKLVLVVAGEPAIDDDLLREEHAARARLSCYRRYCPSMPDDGGTPALAPKLEARVRAERSRRPAPPASCPNCFVVLPLSGVCDTCG